MSVRAVIVNYMRGNRVRHLGKMTAEHIQGASRGLHTRARLDAFRDA